MEHNEKDLNQSGGLGTKTSHSKYSSPIFSAKMHLLEYTKSKHISWKIEKKTREQKFLRMAKNMLQKVMLNVAMTSVL